MLMQFSQFSFASVLVCTSCVCQLTLSVSVPSDLWALRVQGGESVGKKATLRASDGW